MKKLFLLICVIIILLPPSILYADNNENSILIKTLDNSEVITFFKESFSENAYILSKNGFGENSAVGTPFSVEFQTYDGENLYLFYFPIINNGKIITYVEVNPYINKNKAARWTAVSKFYDDESDLKQLRDGNIYSIISDKNTFSQIAVSDDKIVVLKPWSGYEITDYDYDYSTPYENKETMVVNIMEPIDIDTSSVIPQTEEERTIFENAQKNGKVVVQENIDSLGAINKNNRLLVPLRDIAELIGCTVEWNGAEKIASVKKDNNTVKFKIGSTEYSINGKIHNLDVSAEIYNNKTYIPLRAVSEALGVDIVYNGRGKHVVISY